MSSLGAPLVCLYKASSCPNGDAIDIAPACNRRYLMSALLCKTGHWTWRYREHVHTNCCGCGTPLRTAGKSSASLCPSTRTAGCSTLSLSSQNNTSSHTCVNAQIKSTTCFICVMHADGAISHRHHCNAEAHGLSMCQLQRPCRCRVCQCF